MNFLLSHSPEEGGGAWAAGPEGEGAGREGQRWAKKEEAGERPPRAPGRGAGGVGLRAGVPAAAVQMLFVWSSLGRRLEVGEAAPHLVAPPEGPCGRSSSFGDD